MAESTPGPYSIGQPGGPAGPFWSLVNQRGAVVAMQITSEANARLLQMAPDMLAMLEQIDLEFSLVLPPPAYERFRRNLAPLIAKAKGGQP